MTNKDRRRSGQYDHVFLSMPERVLETFRALVSLIVLEWERGILYSYLRFDYASFCCLYAQKTSISGNGKIYDGNIPFLLRYASME
jgi:hypothetical protein